MTKVAQRQVLASIVPVSASAPKWNQFKFAQLSGGEITASVEKIYEGGATYPTVICAPYEIGDLTLTAHFDDDTVANDGATGVADKLRKLRTLVGQAYYDVTVTVYDCGLASPKPDRIYANCLLVGLTEPDGDSSAGAPATFALTFSVQNVATPTTTTATA
jgi:hypothetical protein